MAWITLQKKIISHASYALIRVSTISSSILDTATFQNIFCTVLVVAYTVRYMELKKIRDLGSAKNLSHRNEVSCSFSFSFLLVMVRRLVLDMLQHFC